MKKNLLLILFLISTSVSHTSAQQLSEPGINWNLLEQIWLSRQNINCAIGSDTIVNGLTYKKVLRNGVPVSFGDLTFPSLIRQTDDGKVYVNDHIFMDTDEILIYNFGLEVMDTFTLSPSMNPDFNYKYVVTSIDTVELLNESLRRQFTLELIDSQFNSTLTWIEGIGDIQGGPFYYTHFYLFDFGTDLLCAYQEENVMVHQNPQYDSCFVTITSTEEIDPANKIAIYPNPVKDILTLDLSETDHSLTEISIYSPVGARVFHTENTSGLKALDMSTLTTGIYYLVLKDKSGSSYSQRIVKR